MQFRIDNANGQFEIIFNDEEIDIINKNKQLTVNNKQGKKFIDGLGLCIANLAQSMCEHNNEPTDTEEPIDMTDDKSN
jgi:23S rRNA-/tRNA-specific pseudouridylate synthase